MEIKIMISTLDYENETMESILTRRSIRRFKPGEILQKHISSIINAGIMAPSPGNRQPWRFHVVKGGTKEKFLQILTRVNEGLTGNPLLKFLIQTLTDAAVLIAVENPNISSDRLENQIKLSFYEVGLILGTAACIENMLLAAHSLGYGSVWMGLYPIIAATMEILKPEGVILGVLPIGIPDANQNPLLNRSRIAADKITIEYS